MIGTRLAHFTVTAHLGSGGMGDVYQATDSKLGRNVAIKLLPEAFVHDGERVARFEREARVLAALNHPNVAGIYGIEESGDRKFLVMELVPGDTLAERIARGPMPLNESLDIAKQIAEALEAAHESDSPIVHRDLKPANVKVTPDGKVKVLDFGLAKALEAPSANLNVSQSPTLTVAATMQGVILGTAAYMSPEQASGRPVDKRADIWAFGVVLWEMLTGRSLFAGETISHTLADVLRAPIDFSQLPAGTPARVRELLRRCLNRDVKKRMRDIGEARFAIEEAVEALKGGAEAHPATPVLTRKAGRLVWGAAAITAIAVVTAGYAVVRLLSIREPARTAFEVQATSVGAGALLNMALSPDGRNLVARVTDPGDGGRGRLWLRPLDRVTWTILNGTEGANWPFWSADGRFVGFVADGKLKTVDVSGAPPQTLADASGVGGGSWNQEGVILFAPTQNGPLFRVAATGGQPVQVTELDESRVETAHGHPRFLPDGVHFLYYVVGAKREDAGIYVGALNSKDVKRLMASAAHGDFAAPDLLLFLRESTLMAQRFDTSRLELSGEPFQVAEQVGSNPANGRGGFTVSANGALAYRTGAASRGRALAWVDRTGKAEATVGPPADYENPRLSPDGKRLAVYNSDNGGDIWITDLDRGASTRFTFDPGEDNIPVWSPDGSSIAFVSNRDGGVFNLYRKNAGGTGEDELLLKTPNNKALNDWSADGRYILYEEQNPKSGADLWVLPLSGDRKPIQFLATPFNETDASFSPDGRWVAYRSNDSGGNTVYVQSFPASGGKWQVSTTRAASFPRWRGDGKELFYDAAGPMMAVNVAGTVPGGAFEAGTPRQLFRGLLNLPPHNYDLTPDGRRFLVLSNQDLTAGLSPIVVVVNWRAGVKP